MIRFLIIAFLFTFTCSATAATDISGRVLFESRLFIDDQQSQNSVLFEPEFYWPWNNENDSILFTPFLRLDDTDGERSYGDIREFHWLHVGSDWELRTGISKVYWGVTESQHLVDIINQTDFIESVDQEEKLGQPMVQLSLIRDWGSLDLFVLPYFRERTFGGKDAHLQGPFLIDTDNPLYESDREERHVDYAIRWSGFIGNWDIGLSYFDGTGRDPILLPELDPLTGNIVLIPFYSQIEQFGLDVQATLGSWLWKLEAIKRDGLQQDFAAMTVGFEYTYIGVFKSTLDLGLLMEFNRDSRGLLAPTPFQKDVFSGGRLTFNDAQSTDLLFGVSFDLDDSNSYSGLVEASRRFGNNWKLNLDLWLFNSSNPRDPVFTLRNDDFVSVTIEYFF